jgi:hypothetical protein
LQQSSKKFLSFHPAIRRALSGFFLVVFGFSIAPRQLLHDAFANHKDHVAHFSGGTASEQLNPSVFFCKCENLVAESPFTSDISYVSVTSPATFVARHIIRDYAYSYSSQSFFFTRRGPPKL